ncbi:MAG: DNA-3-methyladenine glycosylase [Candidatus Melainabacteria bacterium]|nr:DNA-3-methyladenine glycosylase [Candidatus Melainabacteria bacterium]
MASRSLPLAFFQQPTLTVARHLLGKILVRQFEETTIAAEIVEVEAYTADDPACHAFSGKRPRCEVMFGPPGYAYVYFIYGMYYCLNVVTEVDGIAGAVLIRALAERGKVGDEKLFSGPGKLCRQLQIDLKFNGLPLFDHKRQLYIMAGRDIADEAVAVSSRIGISKALERPWRFYLKDDKSVSGRK